MATALGDFLVAIGDLPSGERLADEGLWPPLGSGGAPVRSLDPAPGVRVLHRGDVRCVVEGSRGALCLAHEPESAPAPPGETEAELRRALGNAAWSPAARRARYAFVLWDAAKVTVTAFTDPFRTYPVFHHVASGRVLVASDLRLILAALASAPRVDRTAIYHYLNFAYIPAPHCAVEGVAKLEPGSRLEARPGAASASRFIDQHYPEDLTGSDAALAADLRERIVATVRAYHPEPGSPWGTYLSGGTDSSSISGILARAARQPRVDSFSIGFAEPGYDEMSFSRIAVNAFGLNAHERMVGEEDAVELLPRLARTFDEPFGNSSAIPTYCCAELARADGKALLIAGDGGDEIFGGNERYAKDQVLGWYHRSPAPVRLAGRALAAALAPLDLHIANRVRNMIRRGTLPNPDRFYSDDSFASDHFEDLLAPQFRAQVERDASLQIQRAIFAGADAASELHRLMYLDLRMTIAESDLIKVLRTARLAGVDVAFPYLDRELIDYTGRLPARHKVRGLAKRHLFKLAMAEILPLEIRRKKKQGFGLPVAVWLRRGGPLATLLREVVLSPRALDRGYFNAAFIGELAARHERGLWDYSSELFRLLMLELWHREFVDPHG